MAQPILLSTLSAVLVLVILNVFYEDLVHHLGVRQGKGTIEPEEHEELRWKIKSFSSLTILALIVLPHVVAALIASTR